MSDINYRNNSESSWACPACNASCNSSGEPLVSDWAVACHIAGKIRVGDRLHRSWALNVFPDINFKDTIPRIAEYLTWAVVEAQREQKRHEESIQVQRPHGLYDKISKIEIRLHEFIENTLKREFGESEHEWWVKGIPLTIRRKCADRREEDSLSQDSYAYTDLIDLQSILNNNWKLFEINFKRISKQCKSKNELLNSLGKLNDIRKVIMHPVRQKDELSPEETQFLDWFDNLTEKFVSTT